jgi:hypothetical protein
MNDEDARAATDERPLAALGHIRLDVDDVGGAFRFFARYGMREVLERPDFAILELRGGTHLIVSKSDGAVEPGRRAPFDLMVDDVDSFHALFVADGVQASPIERGSIHDSFLVEGPSGYRIPVNSSHAVGVV